MTDQMNQTTLRVRSYIQANTSLQIEAEILINKQLIILVIFCLTMTRDILTLLVFQRINSVVPANVEDCGVPNRGMSGKGKQSRDIEGAFHVLTLKVESGYHAVHTGNDTQV